MFAVAENNMQFNFRWTLSHKEPYQDIIIVTFTHTQRLSQNKEMNDLAGLTLVGNM